MKKINGHQHHREEPDMGNKRSPNAGNARFIELGSPGQPFRSLINVDHLTNIRYELDIDAQEEKLNGYKVTLMFGEHGQTIAFEIEEQAVNFYNSMLDQIGGTGCPIIRVPKLTVQAPELVNPSGDVIEPDADAVADAVYSALDADSSEQQ